MMHSPFSRQNRIWRKYNPLFSESLILTAIGCDKYVFWLNLTYTAACSSWLARFDVTTVGLKNPSLLVLIPVILCYIFFAHAVTSWPVNPHCFEKAQFRKIQYKATFSSSTLMLAYHSCKRMVFIQPQELSVMFNWSFSLKSLYEECFFSFFFEWKSDSVRCFLLFPTASDLRTAKHRHGGTHCTTPQYSSK